MKHCTKLVFAALAGFITLGCIAQKPSSQKPLLFKNYPPVIICTETQLNSLFNAATGSQVNLQLPGNLALQGMVTSKVDKYNNLQTLTIHLPAFNNIIFSVTKRFDAASKAVLYVGHLFNTAYADGYELKRNANNAYQFIKIDTETLLPTCNQ